MARPRAVVFDLDGTLIDSRRDIAVATNAMLAEHHLPTLTEQEVTKYIGDGARALVAGAAGLPLEDGRVDGLLASYLRHYSEHPTAHTTWMPGTREALEALSGLPLAVCTNKSRSTTELVLRDLGLERYFATVVAGGDTRAHKPDAEPLLLVARRLRVEPDALVMVGDGPQDIGCARAVGARSVGVEGGILPIDRLRATHPDVLIRSLAELPEVVRSFGAAI